MVCPKCNEQHDIYSAIIGPCLARIKLWLCPKCKVALNGSDADIPPTTESGISADKVLIDDVEQTLGDKSTTRDKIKQAVIDVIGKDRPFMDVADIAEEITQNVMGIMAQNTQEVCEYCGKPKNSPNYAYHICVSAKKEALLSVLGGVVDAVYIPPGIVVKVYDYDIEGCDEDKLTRDKDGNLYHIITRKAWS